VLVELAREYRRVISYDEVPPVLRHATLAAADKNFFAHSGVEYRVLPRVVYKMAMNSIGAWWSGGGFRLRLPQGGSTLTQQIVRGYFLRNRWSLENGAALFHDRAQPDLFVAADADEAIPVRLTRIRLERGRMFGDVWLGWTLWRALKLDEGLARLLPEGREAVPWATMAAVLVLARLCEPSSELHIAETWYRGTALEDLLALPAPLVNDDRLYRALDRLVLHKTALERHLVARLGELFALDYDLLLYDVTSIYFEGVAEANPLARRGHSRDHRPDCKQVCLALVVTREGMPLGYEVFAGNRTDVTTVEEIVEAMEARYGLAQRIWVMDRGMTSEDNLEWLRQTGRRYLVGTPKSELKKWARAIAEARDWHAVRDGIEAQALRRPGRDRDLRADPLHRAPRKGARDARALRPPHRGRCPGQKLGRKA
jgi:hypothetical protein